MIIGIAGADGAGKSTLAKALTLISLSERPVVITSFAQALREELIADLRLPREEVYAKPTPDHIRKALREHGAFRRRNDVNYWCNKLMASLDDDGRTLYFIDDVRFINEAHAIRKRGGIILFLGCADEFATEPSFAELWLVKQYADILLPAKPNAINRLVPLLTL